MAMEVVILGCGTSTGVPIMGCPCPVCQSPHPRNKRLRSSVAVILPGGEILLIDTSPDLRQQGLVNGIFRVDSVLFTHTHADHTHGIDELRTYNYLQRGPIDIYGAPEHLDHIRNQFAYIFEESVQRGGGKPQLNLRHIRPGEAFELFGARITPLRLWHGKLLCIGWRIGDFAYLTDVNRIPEETRPLLEGVKLLILGALRPSPHTTHFSLDEAAEEAGKIDAERCLLTHMGHEVDYEQARASLPEGVEPAYDGLRIRIP